MTYSVGTLWIIYVAVLVGTWLLLWFLLTRTSNYYGYFSYGTALFIATIFAAIAAFIGAAWLDPNQLTDSDKSWLTVLFLIAFLLPVFVLIYLFWFNEASTTSGCCMDRVKQTIQCDRETGLCHLQKKTIYQHTGDIIEVIYTK